MGVGKLLLSFMLLVILAIAGLPQGRVGIKTLLFLPQVVPSLMISPQEWFSQDPLASEVSYPVGDSQVIADLYRPAIDDKHAAVLLFLGVDPAGRDDPRVVGLAKSLARTGMVVLVPWSEGMSQQHISPKEVDRLVAGFQYLTDLEFVDPERAGLAGFCIGASLAFVAAADPRIANEVSFINFFGGYYNATDLMAQVASKQRFYKDTIEHWTPSNLSRRVFLDHLIALIPHPHERELLHRTFVAGDIVAHQEKDSLSHTGQVVYRLIEGVELQEARSLLEELPEEAHILLDSISPSDVASKIHAKVLVMADREDTMVPAVESRRLATTFTPRDRIHYTEFSFFDHLDPTRPVAPLTFLSELRKLYMHMYHVLREAA